MTHPQEIVGSEPRAIGGQDPRPQQHRVRAFRPVSQLRSYRQQPANLGMGPRNWAGRKLLDAAKRPHYTGVHQPLVGRELEQPAQHAAVVIDGGGRQMDQCISQVGVDSLGRQLGGSPRQAAAQYLQLFQVSGTPADTVAIEAGQGEKLHGPHIPDGGRTIQRRGVSLRGSHRWSRRYNRNCGQLAQLVSGLSIWLSLRRWPIIRGLLILLMAIAFWLRLYGEVMVLWAIRQLGVSIR